MKRKILSEEEKQRKLMIKEFLKDGKIKTPEDLNNLFKSMMKDLIEECYQGEIDVSISRDRNGNYEPQLIKKHQNTIGKDLEAKIISMYAKGMTTNSIEGFNRQLRKVTKSKTIFPTDDSLLKMLYLATVDITKKWTSKYREWGQILSQFQIYFEDRI